MQYLCDPLLRMTEKRIEKKNQMKMRTMMMKRRRRRGRRRSEIDSFSFFASPSLFLVSFLRDPSPLPPFLSLQTWPCGWRLSGRQWLC